MCPTPLPPRKKRLDALASASRDESSLDVLVIGGGITGAGIALDLRARGLSTAIVERGDWASATSSASSRLIHGGLRYLEQFEFGLVRESCLERGLLMKSAAGLVWPERFTFPIHRGGPVGRAKLAAGLLLYTAVSAPRTLGQPSVFGPQPVMHALPGVLRDGLRGGGSYLDGATNDSRLTLAVVATAIERGALALSRVEATAFEPGGERIEVELRDTLDDARFTVRPRAVVLAAGPATDELRRTAGLTGSAWIQPTRGAHVLVPRERLPTDGAIILNSSVDGRVLFLLAWPRFTVIGTTDLDDEAGKRPRATRGEIDYLLETANAIVPGARLTHEDVVSTYAGLRPLLAANTENPSERSREERVERDGRIYSIAGGKLTGFRAMAEKLGARVARDLGTGDPSRHSPTRDVRLRGALARPVGRPAWSRLAAHGTPRDDADPVATAWATRYAAFAPDVRALLREEGTPRRLLAPDTVLGEVDWAVAHDDCLTAADFLFRRTDVGLEPRSLAEAASEPVLERMACLLHWSGERRERERERVAEELAARHAWRDD